MSVKKSLILFLQRFRLYVKAFGKSFLVQYAAVFAVLPVLSWLGYKRFGVSDAMYSDILHWTQLIIPLFAVLPGAFLFDSFLEQDGCELMFIGQKTKLITETLKLFIPYSFAVSVLYCFYIRLFDNMKLELLKILMISFFLFAVVCLCELLSHTVAVGLAVTVVYTCFNMFLYGNRAVFPLFYTLSPANKQLMLTNVLPLFCIGIVLLTVSFVKAKRSSDTAVQ